MKIVPYLNFDGQCREAFDFYQRALRGEIVGAMTIGESPMAADAPPESHDRLIHIQLDASGASLMGADVPPGQRSPTESQTCINVMVEDDAEAERIFHALAEGGSVQMPIQETFWAHRFGLLTDRYGKPWMVNHLRPC